MPSANKAALLLIVTTGVFAAGGPAGAAVGDPPSGPVTACTLAQPTALATVEIRIAYADDFCELLSPVLGAAVFHTPVAVMLGTLWHYADSTVSRRLQYRDTASLTVRNSRDTCEWLERHATGWTVSPPV
jgi:hypothetical protein